MARFPWDDLSSYRRAPVERANQLGRLLPRRTQASRPLGELARELEALTGLGHDLHVQGLRVWEDPSDLPVLGDAFLTKLQLPPDPEVGIVAIEMELVDSWLASILDAPPEVRDLGRVEDREFAAVTFLLLSMLDTLKQWGAPPVVLPTEPPLSDVLEARLSEADALVELTLGVRVNERSHLLRLVLPDELIRRMEVFAESPPERRADSRRLRDGPLGALSFAAPVTVGRTRLRRSVAAGLDSGDVVVFDEHGCTPVDGPDSPDPDARIYLRKHSLDRFLPGLVRARAGRWAFEIAASRLQPHDDPMTDSEDHRKEGSTDVERASDESASTELLESPEVELEVRVGRAELTVRDLAELGAGHVLELDRKVGDRVDLLVEGEEIGSGELVEIEGTVGVRIDRLVS